jgi:hypothetical protein
MKGTNLEIRHVLETDFKQSEVQRDELAYYEPLVQRGSFRVKEGLFRTESEQRAFIVQGNAIRFAKIGTGLHLRNAAHTLLSVIRSLFAHNATDRQTPKTS